MATNPPPNPVIGDLILVAQGGTQIDAGLYVVTAAAAAAGPYTVAPSDNPRQNHAGTVAKNRILAVYRAA